VAFSRATVMRIACRRHRGRCHGLQFERQRSPVREPVSKTLPPFTSITFVSGDLLSHWI
jgi:hypothetical protein